MGRGLDMMDLPDSVEKVYRLHMASMGANERARYEGKIASIEWDQEEQVYVVRFENGDWWHYDTRTKTWY